MFILGYSCGVGSIHSLLSSVSDSSDSDLREQLEVCEKDKEEIKEKLDRLVRGTRDVDIKKHDFQNVIRLIDKKYTNVTSLDVKAYDRVALLVDKSDATKIVEEDLTNTREYIANSDSFVCNHFSFVLSSLIKLKYHVDVGVVLSLAGQHAYNLFVFPDGEIETFEPQENKWSPRGKRYKTNHSDTMIIFP